MKVTYSEHARVCNEREQLAGKLRLAESDRSHWKAEVERLRKALEWQCEYYCEWYDRNEHNRTAGEVAYEMVSEARKALAAAAAQQEGASV